MTTYVSLKSIFVALPQAYISDILDFFAMSAPLSLKLHVFFLSFKNKLKLELTVSHAFLSEVCLVCCQFASHK